MWLKNGFDVIVLFRIKESVVNPGSASALCLYLELYPHVNMRSSTVTSPSGIAVPFCHV